MGLKAMLGLNAPELAAGPTTPAAGRRLLFPKSDGWYEKSSAGNEVRLGPVEVHTFSITGALTTQTGKSRVYVEGGFTVLSVRASVNTQPTGATLICDVNKNGTTIYTTQGNRPTIAVSTNTATANSPDVTTFVAGDYLSADLDQIGSTVAGSDLTVTVRLRRTS